MESGVGIEDGVWSDISHNHMEREIDHVYLYYELSAVLLRGHYYVRCEYMEQDYSADHVMVHCFHYSK